jgi:asparagine synthase (glutamine-hydrolysing)
MRAAIRYRGRDSEGEWVSPGEVALFHSRLSILDIEGGAQPMVDTSGRYVIVFNGEIYNYLELRRAYEVGGARFRTNSDTEVVLEGFKRKGLDVCRDLNGMFAFAIWDTRERRLFLARDRLGKKPLYWTVLSGVFFFASSLDAFRHISGWTSELSRLDLDAYSAVGDFLPGRTAFKQGRSLPPASYATVDLEGEREPRVEVYWRMDFSRKFEGSFEEATDAFEELIADATAIRLRADVPIALTFSGGVDSGIIAAVARRRLNVSLSCWTIDYHTDDDPSEETQIADRVACHLGLEWHYQHFDYHNDLVSSLREVLGRVDQPCRHIAISYSDRLYSAIRPKATVVLSGNGADELFLGYTGNETLAAQEVARRPSLLARMLPSSLAEARRSRELADYQSAYVRANLGTYPGEDEPEIGVRAIGDGILESNVSSFTDLYTYMALRHYTSDANFRIPDIAGLAEQVEVRSPFLDHRIVEFAAGLPLGFKIGDPRDPNCNKWLLKHYYARHVPDEVAWTRKKGMGENLRYDRTLATDPELLQLYAHLLDRIADAGLAERRYREAWEDFKRDKRSGVHYPASAGVMATGLMLGLWLEAKDAR